MNEASTIMAAPTQILVVPGSLRRLSLNRGLANAACELAPDGVEVTIYSIADIPLYNGDVDADGATPAVHAFADAIRAADAVLFISPEYNRGVPGVLRNAIDWVSRQTVQTPLRQKPVGVTGVSNGVFGTIRGQAELKHLLAGSLGAYVMHLPDLMIGGARDKFNEHAELTDDATRDLLRDYLTNLVAWAQRVSAVDRSGVGSV